MTALLACLVVVLLGDQAAAQTLAGPTVPWTGVVDQLIDEFVELASFATGIGLFALAIGLMNGISIERIALITVAGAILSLGAGAGATILGAELAP